MKLNKNHYLKIFCLILMVIYCLWQPAFSSSTTVNLTLRDAILLAMRSNPNVQSAELQRVIDRMNLAEAHWAYAVQYSVTGSVAYSRSVVDGLPAAPHRRPEAPTRRASPGNRGRGKAARPEENRRYRLRR